LVSAKKGPPAVLIITTLTAVVYINSDTGNLQVILLPEYKQDRHSTITVIHSFDARDYSRLGSVFLSFLRRFKGSVPKQVEEEN